jgi:mRNA interferase MazF
MTRGAIYFVKMPEHNTTEPHSCERGFRPVVIVSSRVGVKTSDIVMVCPITTKIKEKSCNVKIGWNLDGRPSQILCNQIVTVPKSELKYKSGYITLEEQKRVDIAMCISLGININYSEVRDYDSKREYVE